MAKGTLALRQIQLGDNADTSKNFLITTPAVADGTLVIKRGNGTDVLSIAADGAVAISGTSTNSDAASGKIGEYLSKSRLFADRIGIASGVAASVVSLSLTAGDWDVSGAVGLDTAATTNVAILRGKIATSVSAISADDISVSGLMWPAQVLNTPLNGAPILPIRPTRVSLSATTTVHLVIAANFTVSTAAMFGQISARRVR